MDTHNKSHSKMKSVEEIKYKFKIISNKKKSVEEDKKRIKYKFKIISNEEKLRNQIKKIHNEVDRQHKNKAKKVLNVMKKKNNEDIFDVMDNIYGTEFTSKVNNLLDKLVIPDGMINEMNMLFK